VRGRRVRGRERGGERGKGEGVSWREYASDSVNRYISEGKEKEGEI
jgi:hypothetical protein